MNENRCVSCGEIIPEGRQVCYTCEHKAEKQIEEMARDIGDVWLASLYGDVKCLNEVLWENDILNIAIELHNIGYRKVEQGEWIDTGDEQLDTIYSGYKCSVCGFIICGHSGKYCCECGAKMRGE